MIIITEITVFQLNYDHPYDYEKYKQKFYLNLFTVNVLRSLFHHFIPFNNFFLFFGRTFGPFSNRHIVLTAFKKIYIIDNHV
jgi:hypothetical protein